MRISVKGSYGQNRVKKLKLEEQEKETILVNTHQTGQDYARSKTINEKEVATAQAEDNKEAWFQKQNRSDKPYEEKQVTKAQKPDEIHKHRGNYRRR